ncbi:hypothetical protein ACHAPT_009504 [Fusarium lateritium]
MIVLLLIGYYMAAYNPGLDPFRQRGSKTRCQYPNAADYTFLYVVRKLPGLRSLQYSELFRSSQLESALNKCVMTFADIQVFTGLAVMISSYVALSCGLQSYHWQLTVYLAWLASLTHLAALSFLRNHLANHPGLRIWRVTAMFIVLVFLTVAVGLAGYFTWDEDSPSEPSDFAVCYLGKKMNTESMAFESMIKSILLLAYGFFIRMAKMSRPFEGGLRRLAAGANAVSREFEDAANQDDESWDPLVLTDFLMSSFSYFACSSFAALFRVLGIHLDLLTSFLAEVYWLTLSALWVTRRYLRTRLLGPKEEDEWTFGQVLPVLLVVAPLAAILEHFLPFKASANGRRQRPSPIALAMLDQLDRDEAQESVRVDVDHQQVGSIACRGGFLLAAVAYIEVGVFFVADEMPGIIKPYEQILIFFYTKNLPLQVFWMQCTLWIPRLSRSSVTKRAVHGIVFSALMAITINDLIRSPTKKDDGVLISDFVDISASIIFANAICFCSFALPILPVRHDMVFRGPRRSWLALFFILLLLLLITSIAVGAPIAALRSPWELMGTLGACLCLELGWYFFELLMEKMGIASKLAIVLRCVLLFCIVFGLGVLWNWTSVAPITLVLVGAVIASGAIWIFVAIIASLFESRQA